MNFCSVCAEQASKDYGKKRLKFKVSDDSSQSQQSNFINLLFIKVLQT